MVQKRTGKHRQRIPTRGGGRREKKLEVGFFLSRSYNIENHNIVSLTRGKRQTDWKDRE